jgi:hypothetical protein
MLLISTIFRTTYKHTNKSFVRPCHVFKMLFSPPFSIMSIHHHFSHVRLLTKSSSFSINHFVLIFLSLYFLISPLEFFNQSTFCSNIFFPFFFTSPLEPMFLPIQILFQGLSTCLIKQNQNHLVSISLFATNTIKTITLAQCHQRQFNIAIWPLPPIKPPLNNNLDHLSLATYHSKANYTMI